MNTSHAFYRKPEGQMEVSRNVQVVMAFYDNLCCMFVSRGLVKRPELFVGLLNAIYGGKLTPNDLPELGKKTIKLERVFNLLRG